MDDKRNLLISMQNYTRKLIQYAETEMFGKECIVSPCPYSDKEEDGDDQQLTSRQKQIFQKALGCVGWLVSCFRCDLAYSYSKISQQMADPRVSTWTRLMHVIQYLKGTSNFAFCVLKKQSGQKPDWELYCDSDHGADKVTRKSRYGSVAELQGFPVHYKTQTTSVAMSVSAIVGHLHPLLYLSMGMVIQYIPFRTFLSLHIESASWCSFA